MHARAPFSTRPTALKWRSETRQRTLASQIGSLLLQRSDPFPILKPNLPSPLPSSLFLRILARIRSQPETVLRFFNFARSDLHFQPDITSISNLTLTLTLAGSKSQNESKKILEPILRSEPVRIVLDSMIRAASNCKDSRSKVLSFVLENYSFLRLIPNSLATLERIRVIDCYCKNGDFRDAMLVLNRMRGKNLVPSFIVYASFLDGGCKFGDDGVTRWILKEMIVRGLLPMVPFLDYDWVVTRLCELEKTFAAEMFIGRARNVRRCHDESWFFWRLFFPK